MIWPSLRSWLERPRGVIELDDDELFGRDADAEALILIGKRPLIEMNNLPPDAFGSLNLPHLLGCCGRGGVMW